MIFGSHNSSAYEIDFSVSFWPSSNKWEKMRKVAKCSSLVRNRIKKMTLTQEKNIAQQLSSGTRAFDLRVAYANKFWCCHTFATVPFNDVINAINLFAANNSDQIILLIKPDFNSGNTLANKEDEFLQLISDTFKDKLNKQVICYYQPLSAKDLSLYHIRDTNLLRSVWFNVKSVNEFISKYETYEPDSAIDVFGFILTPSEDISFSNIFTTSLKDYANQLNPLLGDLLKEKLHSPYILIKDFV